MNLDDGISRNKDGNTITEGVPTCHTVPLTEQYLTLHNRCPSYPKHCPTEHFTLLCLLGLISVFVFSPNIRLPFAQPVNPHRNVSSNTPVASTSQRTPEQTSPPLPSKAQSTIATFALHTWSLLFPISLPGVDRNRPGVHWSRSGRNYFRHFFCSACTKSLCDTT